MWTSNVKFTHHQEFSIHKQQLARHLEFMHIDGLHHLSKLAKPEALTRRMHRTHFSPATIWILEEVPNTCLGFASTSASKKRERDYIYKASSLQMYNFENWIPQVHYFEVGLTGAFFAIILSWICLNYMKIGRANWANCVKRIS